MSKNTFFHTRFWQDTYISDLDPIEKLLFVYALTSPYLGLTGIYETPIKHIAFETGLDRDMVVKIFERFATEKKVVYHKGWLCVTNYPKYQSFKGEKLLIAVEREIKRVPKDILDFFIGFGYPIDTLSIPSMDMDRERDKDMEVESVSKIPDYGQEFETFWKQYPNKKAKPVAERAWLKMRPVLETVLTSLALQKQSDQWTRDGGKYIPHPATWLNGKRWEDEVEVTKADTLIL
jgi:hypothetical protein